MTNNLPNIQLPNDLNQLIQSSFVRSKAYGQVSTLHNGQIFPRTVHINYHPDLDRFFINMNTRSRKYQTAVNHEQISGCYWDINASIQFIWQAKANSLKTDYKNHEDLQKEAWLHMREEIRLAYYLDHDDIDLHTNSIEKNYSLDVPAPNHDVLIFSPHYWDIFEVSLKEHRLSTRTLYTWSDKDWKKQNVSILHTP